jgi:hypothetical protein
MLRMLLRFELMSTLNPLEEIYPRLKMKTLAVSEIVSKRD